MTVRSLFPILRTADLASLVTFYERAFGATVTYRFEDVYVSLAVGAGALAVGLEPQVVASDRVALWLYVDDVDAAYRAALAAGGTSVEVPADMPWDERVAQVRDVDGNPLYLGAPAG
ncbi:MULTISPECIES: VOC family protein [unclassified Microbacterium]|uniref:VOC family protein n=1 Tax=unclassified Microbacterium TaxID=2609290 RepID=UPI00214AF832|nr:MULTISPECIES: VOC family protein [unclassified Microbacterium]MCR2783356.1 VOC family protein [Microbacterium sp. zg.B96]MDL5351860.1 VOC family protein [Microbacterium sp. zg-YB36]WIM15772.1 VOC family protein [Microbacterium sp. zg-B96]